MSQKGLAPIIAVLVIAVVLAIIGYILFTQGFLRKPLTQTPKSTQKPTFDLKESYQNPFQRTNQYKNPFENLK